MMRKSELSKFDSLNTQRMLKPQPRIVQYTKSNQDQKRPSKFRCREADNLDNNDTINEMKESLLKKIWVNQDSEFNDSSEDMITPMTAKGPMLLSGTKIRTTTI